MFVFILCLLFWYAAKGSPRQTCKTICKYRQHCSEFSLKVSASLAINSFQYGFITCTIGWQLYIFYLSILSDDCPRLCFLLSCHAFSVSFIYLVIFWYTFAIPQHFEASKVGCYLPIHLLYINSHVCTLDWFITISARLAPYSGTWLAPYSDTWLAPYSGTWLAP